MALFRRDVASWRDELDDDPEKKKKIILIVGVVLVLVIMLFLFLGFGLKAIKGSNVKASELIGDENVHTERNDAGGIIVDIDWDNVIGYDRDGNPIYGTNGLVASVGGYDMVGAPILKEDMHVIGKADDGLPIYDYSAIEAARMRGLTNNLNPDIDWNTVVAYDADGNPIFGTFGADDSIFGYDLMGNPIYKKDVEITGYSDSGIPYIKYSTRDEAVRIGKKQREEVLNNTYGKDGKDGSDGKNGDDGSDGSSADGKDGTSGGSGKDGLKGRDGSDGTSGRSGTSGKDGKGTSGTDGKDGSSGTKGKDGSAGAKGAKGADGYSVQGLRGPKGDKGNTGARGSDGAAGARGNDGQRGADGQKGATGVSGKDGKDGAKGADGVRGKDGEKGDAGATGAQGAQGKQGERGEAGEPGQSTYTHIKYCDRDPSNDGSAAIYDKPSVSTKFIGIYSDNSKVASNAASSYVWTRLKDLAITPDTDTSGDVHLIIQ